MQKRKKNRSQFCEQTIVRTEISEEMLNRTERNCARKKFLNAADTVMAIKVVHSNLMCYLFQFHASGQ